MYLIGTANKLLTPLLPRSIIVSSVYGFNHSTGPTLLCTIKTHENERILFLRYLTYRIKLHKIRHENQSRSLVSYGHGHLKT